ncbi:MAG: DUF3795 domain-containing protein [Anaerolineae bacterium]|nr:DUF3795 domain-containing protein [Anaerolineae bacterium]
MEPIIAYCGLTCTDCPALVATQADDQTALEKVAAQWREQFNAPEITAAVIVCDGCNLNPPKRLSAYCSTCQIRACATGAMHVPTCAHCENYEDCELLANFLVHAPEAKATLERIHQTL